MALVHQVIPVGPFACNCHVLADEASKSAVIIDPGDEPGEILAVVKDLGVRVTHLLHTHGHLDHIIGTRRLKEETGAKILIHAKDRKLYETLRNQCGEVLRLFGLRMDTPDDPLPVDETIDEGAKVPLGASELRVLHTPGHTPGSCCFRLDDRSALRVFSGDTMFAGGGIGRTDLWGGNHDLEIESIRTRLRDLDPDTEVYPGHGPPTRIALEKRLNPFLQ